MAVPLRSGWFDWLPWRRAEPEPVAGPMTVLGMEPLTALLLLVGVLGLAFALYYRPRAVLRGFTAMMGEISGAVAAIVLTGVVIAGGLAVALDVGGLTVLVVLAIIGVIALIGWAAGGLD